MTREDIIKLANDMAFFASIWIDEDSNEVNDIVKFAKLVAAKERSDCVFTVSVALLGSEKQLADRVINALLTRG